METLAPGTVETKRSLIVLYIARVCAALLAALFLLNFFSTVRLILAWYSPLPLMDYWRVVQDTPAYYAHHLSVFWHQHNEHRIVFPEIVFAIDTLLFHGRMILPLIANSVCYVGIWGVLVWAAYSEKHWRGPQREIGVLLAGALMLWQGCAALLATPFQLTITMEQFTASLSFAFLALLAETGGNIYLGAVMASALVSTYSSAGGMVVWPLVILGAILLKISQRQVIIIAVSGALSIGIYFIGYRSMGHLHVLPLAQHFGYALTFVAEYLAMPFDQDLTRKSAELGLRIGLASLIIFAACIVAAVRKRIWNSRLVLVGFGTYFYVLAGAVLTAAGRMEPDDPFFVAAKAPRYVTIPMAAMGTLALTALWLLGTTRLRRFALPAAMVTAVLACLGWNNAESFTAKAAQDFAQLQINTLMLRNNLADAGNLSTIFPDAEFVKFYLPQLRERRLSIFARGDDKWPGQNVESLYPFAQPVPGEITRVYPVQGGLEIYGWSDSPFPYDDHAVLFVDQNGKITGFGKRPTAGFPLNFGTWNTPRELAFVGFIRTSPSVQSLRAYVWAHPEKTLHRMGDPIAIPNIIPAAKSGAILPGITWKMDKTFRLNGQVVHAENGPAPQSPIYGSSGPKFMGELRSDAFAAPPNHCLVLPVLHGSSAYGQSVKLMNADTNAEIATAPMLDGRSVWERWQIILPGDASRVFILAQDSGEGVTQWLAVAAPAACE